MTTMVPAVFQGLVPPRTAPRVAAFPDGEYIIEWPNGARYKRQGGLYWRWARGQGWTRVRDDLHHVLAAKINAAIRDHNAKHPTNG